MKPEPLSGKLQAITKNNLWTVPGYSEEDIRSAVEWLKENLENIENKNKTSLSKKYGIVIGLIDKAFEDVIKEKI